MKNNTERANPTSRFLLSLGQISLAAAILLLAPVAGFTQETTSSIRGNISGPDGNPAVGASVRIVDTRTGRAQTGSTSDSGRFQFSGMSVGGPYSMTVNAENAATQTVTDIYLSLGETYELVLALSPAQIEEIVVTSTMVETARVAVGPNATFNFDDLQNLPAINRDIRDIIRVDPRVTLDVGFVDAVQCVGANPRFNAITVDGVRQNDNFGLNSNGYPTQRMPFPYDAVQNVAIEMAPFDVQYGGFTACNINAVTKSGTNEFSGRVWYDYTDDSLTGDKLEGTSFDLGSFDESRYGLTFGGPIIQDKLFFFVGYEKAETADTFDRCAGDQACGRPVRGVSQAQLDRIEAFARSATGYDFDPGAPILNAPNEDEKYIVRLDWNVTDEHRAALTYAWNDGFNTAQSDNDNDEYEFSNHYYERGAEFESWSGQLFSDWTDTFSTELRIGFNTLDNRQIGNDTSGFGEVRIETYADPDGDGLFTDTADVYLGTDDSRQSNKLDYDTTNFKLAGTWVVGDHLITGGYEFEEVDIFNMFVQHTIGEYRFDEMCNPGLPDGCIAAFEDFSPDDIYYGNHVSLNPRDAAALFAYQVNSLYLQDEFTFDDINLTLVAGLRYDWYTSDDLPQENANFIARSGFTNRKNFDDESLIQPRFGFQWDATDTLSFHGGFGLFSGGNPNVWLGNNYQNDGFTQIQAREFNVGLSDLNTDPLRNLTTEPLGVNGMGRPIYDAPQVFFPFITGSVGNSSVNAVAPGFSPPSNWKFALGGIWEWGDFGWGSPFTITADGIYSRGEDSAIIVDDTYVQIGSAPDGRPIYFPTDKSIPGCAQDPLSDPPGCDRLFTGDYILDNVKGDDVEQLSLSFSIAQEYEWGLDWMFAYAYTESDDVSPMTSSVAFSNYFNISVRDPNNPGRATSNYETPHRFILRLGFERAFFGDYRTRFSLIGEHRQGRPFSYTFIDQAMFVQGPFFNPDDDRSLLYMPSGMNDPLVQFGPGFDTQAFFEYAAASDITKYGGGIVPRNEFYSPWWTSFDLRISQEIPGFGENHYAQGFLIIENLTNLLNDDWGVYYEQGFPRNRAIVDASLLDINGTPGDPSDDIYSFDSFRPVFPSRRTSPSLWAIRIGFSYNF